MKVITSSLGTFHILEQAIQLQKKGALEKFITGIPSILIQGKQIPKKKITSIWQSFLIAYAHSKINTILNSSSSSRLLELTHNDFSRRLAKKITNGTELFIGGSSFCSHAIEKAKSMNIKTVVDHGSLHETYDLKQMMIEKDKYGFKISGNSKHSWLRQKEDKEFQLADHIFVTSEVAKSTFVEEGIPSSKVIVNNLGVSLSKFKRSEKLDNKFRVLYCGNVIPRKGIHYLLKSFKKLNLPNSELLIIGSLNILSKDNNFKKYLSKFNQENIIFKGVISSHQLSEYFSQCSVMVLPSLSDGFGRVINQAMACELPVIVSNQTGAADLIINGVNGLITKARDVDALSKALEFHYLNKEESKRMGKNGFNSIKGKYTWDNYGEQLERIIKTIIP